MTVVSGRNLKQQCTSMTRNCRKCGHRYEKGDKSENCPVCGESRRCQCAAVLGTVCRMHGGGSPLKGRPGGRPPKDGIFRHLLPKRMLDAYDKAYEDTRLTELRRDIALLEARRADLITRADDGESGETWRGVKRCWRDYRQGILHGFENSDQKRELEYELDELILNGTNDADTWREIEKVTAELRRSRVDETKRLKEMQQMISTERLFALMGKVVNVIEVTVQEREQRHAIAVGIRNLLEDKKVIDAEWSEVNG